MQPRYGFSVQLNGIPLTGFSADRQVISWYRASSARRCASSSGRIAVLANLEGDRSGGRRLFSQVKDEGLFGHGEQFRLLFALCQTVMWGQVMNMKSGSGHEHEVAGRRSGNFMFMT